MGRFLALIGGFLVSLGMFAFGLGFATWLLMAEPVQRLDPSVDVAGLWTGQPRRIDTKVQDFERLPGPADHRDAKPSGGRRTVPAATQAADDPASGVDDTVVTSAVRNAPGEEPRAAATVDAHIDWCAARYRSYRRSDDTYQPYRGGRRPCVSPYFGDPETAEERAPPPAPDSVIYAADADDSASVEYLSADALGSGAVTPEHAAYCFSRYRSYRPEDNTYQPYGGGPRRECR